MKTDAMSAQRQNKFESLCRLCTSVESNNLHIFGDEGEGLQLASKIRICLPIFVHREDTLPKVVCLPCVTKLESFYSFREACVKAEGTLEAYLKEEQNFPHEPEVCLEEGFCAKAADSVNCKKREDEKQGKGRGRKKKGKGEENQSVDGGKGVRRGKKRKILEAAKDLPCMQVSEVNGNNMVEESRVDVQEVTDPLEELPIPLSPGTNLSQDLLPQLGELHPDDYLLIKEEKFLAEPNWNIENFFPPNHAGGLSFIKEELNSDIVALDGSYMGIGGGAIGGINMEVDSLKFITGQTRQFLPPVWDVFEKVVREPKVEGDTAVVTHRRYIVGKKAFPCALCGNCFLLSGDGNVLENGRRGSRTRGSASSSKPLREEGTERPYGCLRCGKRYFRRSDLVRHEKTHLESRPFVCRLCGKGFCRKEHAQRHMSLHVGEKPFRCDDCLKLFTRKEHLARHKRCHHPESILSPEGIITNVKEEPKEVPASNKTSITPHLHQRNPKARNTDQRFLKEQTSSESSKSTPKKAYQCEICIRVFSRREHLVRHRRSHFREQMKAASLAMATVRYQQAMQEDSSTVIDGLEDSGKSTHSCRFCTQTFSCKELLDRHTSRMHPLAEAVSAMAPPSPGDDTQPEDFSDMPHNSMPSPSPPHLVSEQLPVELIDKVPATKQSYCCILCPQTFSRKENLERHLKSVHAGLKPYACNICGKRFGRAEQCRRHENRHQRYQGDINTENNNGLGPGEGIEQLQEHDEPSAEPAKENTLGVYDRLGYNSAYVAKEMDNQKKETVISENVVMEKSKHSKLKGATKDDSSKQHSHRSKRIKSYSCQGCGSIFPKKKHLAKHKCVHASDEGISK